MSRLDYNAKLPELRPAIRALDKVAADTGIDPKLRELIKIRASQINGCAFCLDMHAKEARAKGETEQRIYALSAWRDTPFFTDAERAALELTEAVTLISSNHISEALYESVRNHFDEKQFMGLITSINVINTWNRIGISTGLEPSGD